MWNQVTSEVILVIRTYAFFNRNNYILAMLVTALAGIIAYQLYVDTSQMLRKCPSPFAYVQASHYVPSAALPFLPGQVSHWCTPRTAIC